MERDISDTEGRSDPPDLYRVTGKEAAVLKIAEELIYLRTLFLNPFPKVVSLNTWVVDVWEEAHKVIGEAVQSERSRLLPP